MKKISYLAAGVLLLFAMPVSAQNQNKEGKQTVSSKVTEIWDKTKAGIQETAQKINDAIGLDDKAGEVNIKGVYYMPLYEVSLYADLDEAKNLKSSCEVLFKQKYPNIEILSEAIPQKTWLSETVKKNGVVVGYRQYLYCYIIAKDGTEGYINAKFAFEKYRDAGKEFTAVQGKWPKWERTDVIPNAAYDALKAKQ